MRYRKLSAADQDYVFGHGLSDFWIDRVEAPAQAVLTRLLFTQGTWFADLSDGTAWYTRVLGRHTETSYDPEIQARIAQTEKVASIDRYESRRDTESRHLVVRALITTDYGQTTVTGLL